ncbi:MAG: ester cyclase [Trueperaceae bacterium]
MSAPHEGNRAIAIAIFTEGWNQGEFARLRPALAPAFDFHVHGEARSMAVSDLERIVASWRQGFPDLRFELHEVVVDADLVAVRATLIGTHRGPWRDRAPSGATIAVDHMFLLRFAGGALVEVWEVLDSAELERQLGGGGEV